MARYDRRPLTEDQKQFLRENSTKHTMSYLSKKVRTGVWAIKAFLKSEGLQQRTEKIYERPREHPDVSEFWQEVNVQERRANLKPQAQPYVFTTKQLPWL